MIGREAEAVRATEVVLGRRRNVGAPRPAAPVEVAGVLVVGSPGSGVSRFLEEVLGKCTAAGQRVGRIVASDPTAARLSDVEPLIGAADDLLAARRALDQAGYDLVVVDDADRLDPASAELLRHAVLDGSCRLLAGAHDISARPQVLTSLWRAGRSERIDLAPLDAWQSEQLLEDVLGGPLDLRSSRQFIRLAGGLPLLLNELIEATRSSGQLVCSAGIWRLDGSPQATPRVLELANDHLRALDDDLIDALDLIAIGEPVPVGVAETVLTSTTLQRLETAGLIHAHEERSSVVLTVRPPVLGLARRSTIGRLRRSSLSSRLVEAIARDGNSVAEVVRARWALMTGQRPPTDDLIVAARQALFMHDLDLARRLVEAAGDGAEARHLLGVVLQEQGHVTDAAAIQESLVHDPAAPAELRALAAMDWSSLLMWSLADPAAALTIAGDLAQDMRGLADGEQLAEVRAFHAAQQLFSGATCTALAMVDELAGSARGRALAQIAMVGAAALAVAGSCDRAVAMARDGAATRRQLGDQVSLAGVDIHQVDLVLALHFAGHFEEADQIATQSLAEAMDSGPETAPAWIALAGALVAHHRGQLTRALALAERATDVFDMLDIRAARRWGLGAQLLILASRGDATRAADVAARLDQVGPSGVVFFEPGVRRAQAWGALVGGRRDQAEALLAEAASLARDTGQLSFEAEALHDLVRLGSPALAASRLGELVHVVDSDLGEPRARQAQSLVDGDAGGLLEVSETFEQLGSPLWAAEAAALAAQVSHADGNGRWKRMTTRRAAELQQATEGAMTPALVHAVTVELSSREREVAGLAVRGLTSREIGATLGISPRTVDNLLHRAYTKLGIGGRRELVEALGPHVGCAQRPLRV